MGSFVSTADTLTLLFSGIFLAIASFAALCKSTRLNGVGVRIQGVVKERGVDADNDSWVVISYRYRQTDGLLQVYYHGGEVGAPVELLVNPNDPTDATVFGAGCGGCMPVLALAGGILMMICAIVIFDKESSRSNRPALPTTVKYWNVRGPDGNWTISLTPPDGQITDKRGGRGLLMTARE